MIYNWKADANPPTADSLQFTADGLGSDIVPVFDLELSEVALGNVQLYWPNWGFDTYTLTINGVDQAPANVLKTVISGLLVDTQYTFRVTGNTAGVPVLRTNERSYSYSDNETATVTYMRRIRPFPSVGFN